MSSLLLLSPRLSPLESKLRDIFVQELQSSPLLGPLLSDPLVKEELDQLIGRILLSVDQLIDECEASCQKVGWDWIRSCFRCPPKAV